STDVRWNDGPVDGAGDPTGSPVPLGSIGTPSSGTAVEDPDNAGHILYTPADGFTGKATYTYTLETADGVESDPITVTIDVKPVGTDDTDVTPINTAVSTDVR